MRLVKEARRVLALALAKQCRKGEAHCPVSGACPFDDIACALVNACDWEKEARVSVARREKKKHEQVG